MERLTPALLWRGSRARAARPVEAGRAGLAALALLHSASPAQAQTVAAATLESNQLFRGETINADNPGISLALSTELGSGFFAGADASFATGPDDPRYIASNLYAGYAVRTGEMSIEAGVIHRDYWQVEDYDYQDRYVEGFVGISNRRGRIRLYVSPDYLRDGRNTFYGEVDARIAKVGAWNLSGHFGLSLIPHDLEEPHTGLADYQDWGLTASRKLGGFDLGLSIAATNYPVFGPSGKARVKASISKAF